MSEDKLHQSCFVWWNNFIRPEYGGVMWHTPNEGIRNVVEQGRQNGMGFIAGIPDLCLCFKQKAYFFELKTHKGKLSSAQKEVRSELIKNGFDFYEIRDLENFKKIIHEILVS